MDNHSGFAYIMSNFQHPGENGSKDPDWTAVNLLLDANWGNKLKTAIGYIGTEDGALPAIK